MRLTTHMLRTSYEYLRTTPPFRSLGLPAPRNVEFRVSRATTFMGEYQLGYYDGAPGKPVHRIRISDALVGSTSVLMQTMAHEMVHLHIDSLPEVPGEDPHGERFRALAKRVCAHHSFPTRDF